MMKTRLSTLLISAMAPLALAAQTDSLLIADDLNLVVVTGTRTPKTLLKTPVMTSVITRAEIEKADATTLQDILRQNVPGVEFSYSMNQQRHMNFSGFGGQSMLILVDGERLAGETMDDVDFDRLTLSNVDHIEIVKGPVSALYGSNANGGVINIITKNSDKPLKLNVNARVGKHDSQRYGLSWTQGFGKWDNSLDVSRNSSANYDVHSASDPVTRVFSTIYGNNTYNFKEQLAFHPTKDINLKAHAGYFFRQTKRSVDTPERYRDYNGGVKQVELPKPEQARHTLLLRRAKRLQDALQPLVRQGQHPHRGLRLHARLPEKQPTGRRHAPPRLPRRLRAIRRRAERHLGGRGGPALRLFL